MCGIAGVFGSDRHEENVNRMVAAMHHRGPNDSGVHAGEAAALGMTRLAILDLSSAGHQPMANAERTVWLVFNGEVYNFREERALLEKQGVVFSSHSDTEVVLRLYERYGDDCVRRMRGMFAFGILDLRAGRGKERLLLARDHLGIKPLLYSEANGRLAFASEMKALLASGLVSPELDPEGLRQVLTFGSVVQPRTIVKGVSMLPAAHRLIVTRQGRVLERYWSLDPDEHRDVRGLSYDDIVMLVHDALEESVGLHMVSDVPVGAFLSGGVDSALVVALMMRISNRRVQTFSVGYEHEGADTDETLQAAKTARFLETEHSRVIVDARTVADRMEHFIVSLDQPTIDGANSYFVSQAASRNVKVAVSGTGGDELFAGYPWFMNMARFASDAAAHPLRSLAGGLLGRSASLSVFDSLIPRRGGWRIERLRQEADFLARYSCETQIFGPLGAAQLLAPELRAQARAGTPKALDLRHQDELARDSTLRRVSALTIRGYLQNQLLRDIDAVSMSHSLEVRVPLVDAKLAQLALALPDAAKLGPNAGATYSQSGAKKILFDVGARYGLLPEGLANQPKRGFTMPFESWLRGSLRGILEDCMSDETTRSRGIFAPSSVADLRSDFFSGRTGWYKPWLVMIVELWCRSVLEKPIAQ